MIERTCDICGSLMFNGAEKSRVVIEHGEGSVIHQVWSPYENQFDACLTCFTQLQRKLRDVLEQSFSGEKNEN